MPKSDFAKNTFEKCHSNTRRNMQQVEKFVKNPAKGTMRATFAERVEESVVCGMQWSKLL